MLLQASLTPDACEAGCDEVGRGCLSGPVVAAAVVWPRDITALSGIKDSKALTDMQRRALVPVITSTALEWAIGVCTVEEIDTLNIAQASYTAMHKAVDQLKLPVNLLVIDGKYFLPHTRIPHHCCIGGDRQFYAVAAASILAKVYRDTYMEELHEAFPVYNWKHNKGYPTLAHRRAIHQYGPSIHHRKSFRW